MPPKKDNKNYHKGHRQRVRTEVRTHGLEQMPDHRLLELMLFYGVAMKDTNEMAHDLLDRFGSISGVLSARPGDLERVSGVGENVSIMFAAIMELMRRYMRDIAEVPEKLLTPADYAEAFRGKFEGRRNECLYMLCLAGSGKLINVSKVSEGIFNQTDITARRITELAVATDASVVVLAHNHTSGILLPSSEDVNATNHLRDVLHAISVQLQDHLIFCGNEWYSMAANGYFMPIF